MSFLREFCPGGSRFLTDAFPFLLRGSVSGAAVQTDGSEAFHSLPDWEQRAEAAAWAAQVWTHLNTAAACMSPIWHLCCSQGSRQDGGNGGTWYSVVLRRWFFFCCSTTLELNSSICFHGNSCCSIMNTSASQTRTRRETSWRAVSGQRADQRADRYL